MFLPNRELAMASNPSKPAERDTLRTLLKDAEEELRSKLRAACEAEENGISTESTQDIRRLEDDLLAAALAAKQTIAVRNQMKRAEDASARPTGKPSLKVERGEQGERQVMGVREFTDDRGRPWRAWSVVPGQSRSSASGGGFLGDFKSGWICFESLGSPARRRLPYPQAKWANLTEEELKRLLDEAADAPLREKKG
jgi:hypothetical protein